MMKQLVLGVGLATALACTAPAAFAQNTTGQKFLKEAMEGSLAEIQMGKLAQEKGNSPGVRDFGKTLVDDHTKAEQKAQDAARSAGLQPVGEPNKKQRDMYQKMSQKSGAAFDRAFIKDMVSDHKKDVKEHEKHAKDSNRAVADYVNAVLPDLRKHLQMAESLQKSETTGSR